MPYDQLLLINLKAHPQVYSYQFEGHVLFYFLKFLKGIKLYLTKTLIVLLSLSGNHHLSLFFTYTIFSSFQCHLNNFSRESFFLKPQTRTTSIIYTSQHCILLIFIGVFTTIIAYLFLQQLYGIFNFKSLSFVLAF